MKCASCQAELGPEDRFCGICGRRVVAAMPCVAEEGRKCPKCGATTAAGQRFCSSCGGPPEGEAAPPPRPSEPQVTKAVPPPQPTGSPEKKWGRRRLNYLFGAAAAAVILAVGFAGYRIYQQESDPFWCYGDKDRTAEQRLRACARMGDEAAVKAYLGKGVNPNARDKEGGWTPLMAATLFNELEVVKLLLAGGADVNAKADDGTTALHIAAGDGHTELAQALIAAGADVNARGVEGSTALISAAATGRTEIVKALVDAGADLDVRVTVTGLSLTPLGLAKRNGHPEAAAILQQAGAKE